jgi:hypothetical protein
MAYIGNTAEQQAFTPAIDYFNGNGSTVAFTLSRPVASVAQVQAVIENVPQNPGDAFTVSGNTITFTSAPPSGTNNIYVYYTSPITQVIQPGQGTVGTAQFASGVTVNFADGSASAPSITNDGDTNTGIFFPAADSIGFTEGGAEIARFDSSGNLGIGTSSPATKLHVSNISGSTQIRVSSNTDVSVSATATATDSTAFMTVINDARQWTMRVNGGEGDQFQIRDSTAGANRIAIDSLGRVGINSPPAAWIGNEQFYVGGTSSETGQIVGNIAVGSSSPSGACSLFLNYASAAPNNNSNSYLICNDNSGVQKLNIYSSGTVSNRTGTYNSLSDLKLKENVVDATPKLDKLMQAKVRNYNLIGDELKQIGFVAQELEQVFPGLVEDVPDFDENQQLTGEVTKMVKTSVLIPILVKAMQEQQAIIEDLKARIETLESK